MAPNGVRSPRRIAPSRRPQPPSRAPNRTLSIPSMAPSRRPQPRTSAALNGALSLRVHRAQRPACPAPNGAHLLRPLSRVCPVPRRASAPSHGVRLPRPTARVSRVQRRAFATFDSSYMPCLPARVSCAWWRAVVMLNRVRSRRSTALVCRARQSLFAVRKLAMTFSYVPALRVCRMISSSLEGSRWPRRHLVVQ
jgi:hypothetical protein